MGIKREFDGWWGGDGFRYKPIGAGTGKNIIPATGMGIALRDGDEDGNSNTRPVCIPNNANFSKNYFI